jgi:hypothetical protein
MMLRSGSDIPLHSNFFGMPPCLGDVIRELHAQSFLFGSSPLDGGIKGLRQPEIPLKLAFIGA